MELACKELECLYGCIDDELIIDVAKKYKIQAPSDIESEYEASAFIQRALDYGALFN